MNINETVPRYPENELLSLSLGCKWLDAFHVYVRVRVRFSPSGAGTHETRRFARRSLRLEESWYLGVCILPPRACVLSFLLSLKTTAKEEMKFTSRDILAYTKASSETPY